MKRHLAVAIFVVAEGHVVLIQHKKHGKWLPPGGHVEKNELPDDAAIREVKEETGLSCVLVGNKALAIEYPQQLTIPLGIQVEDIDSEHQHIDLVYLATTATGKMHTLVPNSEADEMGWFNLETITSLPLTNEILQWVNKVLHSK